MDVLLLRMFQRQLQLQSEFLLLAANDLNRGIATENTTIIFFALQNLIVAAGNMSKAL
jgi:hypothetical protein